MKNLIALRALSGRALKIFLRDKAAIFFSLLAPLITFMLYVLFLKDLQVDSLLAAFPQGLTPPTDLIDALMNAWMVTGVLATGCFTVSLGSTTVMVQDKERGFLNDALASPVKGWVVKFSYFTSVFCCAATIMLTVTAVCFVYLAATGWYMSFADTVLALLAIIAGCAVSTLIAVFISDFFRSAGAHSGFLGITSAVIGFIMGVYMPLSMMPSVVIWISSLFAGSYFGSLIRYYLMRGCLAEISLIAPAQLRESISQTYMVEQTAFFNTTLDAINFWWALAAALLLFVAANYLVSLRKSKRK